MTRRVNLPHNHQFTRATTSVAVVLTLSVGAQVFLSPHHGLEAVGQQRAGQALAPEEWMRDYACPLELQSNSSGFQSQQERLRMVRLNVPWYKRLWFDVMHECNRDQLAWRFLYVNELLERGFSVLIRDESTDERLANIVYLIKANSLMDLDHFKFNSGDTKLDRANERRVAGASVSDQQCARDMNEMEQQFDELTERLDWLRSKPANSSLSGSPKALEERHIRLARVLDAFGRYESGSLSGHSRALGAHEQCVQTDLERRTGRSRIGMRFCWARLSLRKHLSEPIRRRPRQQYETADESLAVGVCLPRSCHTRNVGEHVHSVGRLLDSQLSLPQSIYLNRHLGLEALFCPPDEDSEFGMPTSGKLWVALAAAWTLLCCAVTYFRLGESSGLHEEFGHMKGAPMVGAMQHHRAPDSWTAAAKCLNLRLSWRDFTTDKREPNSANRVHLDVLNPVKIFACTFCVAAHSMLMFASVCDRQIQIAARVERDSFLQAALIASVVVDSFFVISGLLLTFIACNKLTAKRDRNDPRVELPGMGDGRICAAPKGDNRRLARWSSRDLLSFLAKWFALASSRYLRLVPLYALMFWFRRDVLTYLGSGPMWDYGFNRDTMNGACLREPWTTPFTFTSAFTPLSKQCFVPSWSISNDIFFGLLMPPFILLLQSRPKLGLQLVMGLAGACSLASLYAYGRSPAPDRWELAEFRLHGMAMLFAGLSEVYTWPVYRVPSFLIGTIAGHALFRYSSSVELSGSSRGAAPEQTAHWPAWLTGLATKAAVAYLVGHTALSLLSGQIVQLLYPYQRLVVAHLMTLDRALWSASNAVLFLRMMTDWKDAPLMRKFAAQRWRTLARLNYAAIFVHWILIISQTGTIASLPSFTNWQLFASFASIYLLTLPISGVIHVLFENPIDKLIKKLYV